MKYFLLLVMFFTFPSLFAQFSDGFDNGNFTSNPAWFGDDSVFVVVDVNGNNRLRSNKTVPSSSYYLATNSTLALDCQWEWFANLQFNTSSTNYVDVYLTADQTNLLSPTLSGYFVRLGGTDDEISLFKRSSGTATKIIDGLNGTLNTSINNMKIKVVRTAGGEWRLDRDLTGSGNNYFTEGIINDVSVANGVYFGLAITQSTATFFQKHFFDDFYVGPIIYDIIPPVLLSASAISATEIDALFNEAVDQISAENNFNYTLQPATTIVSAIRDGVNPNLVHLTTGSALQNGSEYTLSTNNIADVANNSSGLQAVQFSYFVAETPLPGDVLITEFMADPSPIVGLPEQEFVEIYNNSNKYFNLNGWKLGDNATEGTIQAAWLSPGEYKVLCPSSWVDSFPNAVGVTSWPSLNNASDDVRIRANGITLDELTYSDTWYQDPAKKEGGYTLERINLNHPCSGAGNWIASNSPIGGTPAAVNSVNNITPDESAPQISQLVALAPNYLEVYFNKGMDSTALANSSSLISPSLDVANTYVFGTFPDKMTLEFSQNITPSQVYTIEIENVADCWLNAATVNGTFILPELPEIGDVIINEILFNPYTGGSDWVELYNRSDKVINLKNWQFANMSVGSISNIKTINDNFLISPGTYAVVGKDSTHTKQNYPYAVSGRFVFCELPSYNNDSGSVILLYNSQPFDKVAYSARWHFRLLDNVKGVSLERIDQNGPSNNGNNWHSAAQAIGFGTPGGPNSQYFPALESGDFGFTSNVFSPDNDGYEDILQINYQMLEPGMLGTITFFDDRGRQIAVLFKNELLGIEGTYKWDGFTDNGTKVSIGTYVAVFEAFGINGGLLFIKRKAFTVAGKL
jgi:hypothetical protein